MNIIRILVSTSSIAIYDLEYDDVLVQNSQNMLHVLQSALNPINIQIEKILTLGAWDIF